MYGRTYLISIWPLGVHHCGAGLINRNMREDWWAQCGILVPSTDATSWCYCCCCWDADRGQKPGKWRKYCRLVLICFSLNSQFFHASYPWHSNINLHTVSWGSVEAHLMLWSTAYVFTTTCNAYSEVLHDTVISKPIRRTIPNLWQILSIPYLFPLRSYYEWAFDVIVRGWVIAYHVCLVGSLTTRSFLNWIVILLLGHKNSAAQPILQ